MRILLVSHRSLPDHPAGTEVHTHQLAREFGRLGHAVLVLTAEKDVSLTHHTLVRRSYDGVDYVALVDNLFNANFEETYANPGAERRFGEVLDEFRPDVVHAAHLLYHSIGYASIARARGLPFVMTLFDFWLMCPRFGQRRFPDGTLCHTIDHRRCGACLSSFKHSATPLERSASRVLTAVRGALGVDLAPLARRFAATPNTDLVATHPQVGLPDLTAARAEHVHKYLVPNVSAFVAPSRFLAAEFESFGLPPERLHFLRTGIDLAPFAGFERVRAQRTRIAFIGSVVPHKGVHVLVEAFERLPADVLGSVELDIHGPAHHAVAYGADLERRTKALGGTWHGALARADLVDALAHTDLLVVPSLWFENAPLVVLEALATSTPVAVSDLGGLRELALETGGGFTFPAGDAAALRALITRVVEDHTLLEVCSERARPLRSIADDARDYLALYTSAAGVA